MVSTRHHPRDFPAADLSPSKSPRKSTRLSTTSPSYDSPSPSLTPDPEHDLQPMLKSNAVTTRRAVAVAVPGISVSVSPEPRKSNPTTMTGWTHTASNITIAWIMISLPLTIWDTLYVLLRPHTFPGGKLQWPLWKPYEVYAAVDHVYGVSAWNKNEGFTGAQGMLNLFECILYGLYISIIWNHGRKSAGGSGAQVEGVEGGAGEWLRGGRKVYGSLGNRAVLIGFSAAVMTLSKTVLYMFNEYFSDFANVKHNDWMTLIPLYCMMNGLWILFPAYMTVTFGSDILDGLDLVAIEDPATLKKSY